MRLGFILYCDLFNVAHSFSMRTQIKVIETKRLSDVCNTFYDNYAYLVINTNWSCLDLNLALEIKKKSFKI